MDRLNNKRQNTGSLDVEMEPIRSLDRGSNRKYNPADIDFPRLWSLPHPDPLDPPWPNESGISAISDLKKFSGKYPDEGRTRAWISKIMSAFMRDQASNVEKCLTFADHFAGSAKNSYHQLGRYTRNKWSHLLRRFQIQYCGLGVSVARQYYHGRRRSDESPLDYLYRLNVAGLRARLKIKDGSTKDRREHVDHFIEILEDPDLADRLILLRLSDANDLEEVLRPRYRATSRPKKAAFGSGKFRQKASNCALLNTCERSRSKLLTADTILSTDQTDLTLRWTVIAGWI
ncbi:hypothetical protein PHMEG_00012826 [Phytophthora megakarya]|uniref:Uncharacterized protein n=1 Tax=Phytophthora megakarya TaxID=4795 RepID=A0A225W8S4_9STRA|nr:hypothetical protein PHMEG_00012826 [Phytophthora megakarya]